MPAEAADLMDFEADEDFESRGHSRSLSDPSDLVSLARQARLHDFAGGKRAHEPGESPIHKKRDTDKKDVAMWAQEEDLLIVKLVSLHGKKWSLIASQLSGRTDNGVRNRWNRLEKAHLMRAKLGSDHGYRCRRCGQPKRGHICPAITLRTETIASDEIDRIAFNASLGASSALLRASSANSFPSGTESESSSPPLPRSPAELECVPLETVSVQQQHETLDNLSQALGLALSDNVDVGELCRDLTLLADSQQTSDQLSSTNKPIRTMSAPEQLSQYGTQWKSPEAAGDSSSTSSSRRLSDEYMQQIALTFPFEDFLNSPWLGPTPTPEAPLTPTKLAPSYSARHESAGHSFKEVLRHEDNQFRSYSPLTEAPPLVSWYASSRDDAMEEAA